MEASIPIVYQDRRVLVALKPRGVLSTDEPGGMPELLRAQLEEPQGCFRTVHRLDRVVGGLMVLARSAKASRELSRQIRAHTFEKRYLAVVHGTLEEKHGVLRDLLLRDRAARLTRVVTATGKDVKEAELRYRVVEEAEGLSLVEITLLTGRTHQIRAQFSHHGHPLVGDRRYGDPSEDCGIALWSCYLGFRHPESGETMAFSQMPPPDYPWTCFSGAMDNL